MKFNDDEKLKIEARPDEKILGVWFLTKTITYSIATMFFVFMGFFFINALDLLSTDEETKDGIVVVEQLQSKSEPEESERKEIDHPFTVFIDYWGWALILVGLSSIVIQIYLTYLRRTYRYIVTDRRCIFVGEILKRVERSVPFKKITDIQRSQNILERMLGIWNVQIFTPGTASMQMGHAKVRAELNFDGLKNSEEFYEIINQYTQLYG